MNVTLKNKKIREKKDKNKEHKDIRISWKVFLRVKQTGIEKL